MMLRQLLRFKVAIEATILLCKAKRQYLVSYKVSRYCLLALQGGTVHVFLLILSLFILHCLPPASCNQCIETMTIDKGTVGLYA